MKNRTSQEMIDLIMNIANSDDRIRVVYLSGSRIDPNAKQDNLSDFDVGFIVDDIRTFTKDDRWLEIFGEILILQKPNDWYSHPYDYKSINNFAYLMQFKDGNRIDLTLVDAKNIKTILENKEPRKILISKDIIEGLKDIEVGNYFNIMPPSSKEFLDCCNEFWWLSLYVVKGIRRQELMYAKFFYDRYQMDQFMKMLNWQIGIKHDFNISTGHFYKHIHMYLTEKELDSFINIFPNGSLHEVQIKLTNLCKTFQETAKHVAEHFDFEYSTEESRNIMNYINVLLTEKEIVKESGVLPHPSMGSVAAQAKT